MANKNKTTIKSRAECNKKTKNGKNLINFKDSLYEIQLLQLQLFSFLYSFRYSILNVLISNKIYFYLSMAEPYFLLNIHQM